jgi:hypothetical protein
MMVEDNSYTSIHRSVIDTFLKMERGGAKSLPIYMWLVGRWEAENGNLDQLPETPSRIPVPEPSIADLSAITERSEATTKRYMKFLTDHGLITSCQNGTLSIAVYMEGAE